MKSASLDKIKNDSSIITDEEMNDDHKIGWFSAMCMVVGLMIGSGIFSTPSSVLKNVKSTGLALVLWLIGGIVSLCGTFSYVELGTMMPKSGGEEVYLRTAYPRPKNLLSFLFCWSMIMVARPGSAAADSVVFAQYMLFPFVGGEDSDPWAQRGMGLACITLITGINIFSTKLAVKIHDCVTIFKVIVLVTIAVTGFLVGTGIWSSVERPDNFTNAFQGAEYNTGVIATTLFNIFYSFDGWNNANYAVGDMKDPSKNLPKAAGLGVSLVCVLYLICNVSYLMVLPKDVMMESDALLAGTFFSYTYGDTMGGKVFPVFIALSAFGAVCAMVYSAARVIFAAAESGYFPFSSVFAKLHPTYKTPVNALLFHWVCVVILMIGPPPGAAFDFLVQFAQYPTWIFYGLAVLGLIRMRATHPHFPRSFRVWIPLSVLFICVSIFLAIFPFVPSKNEMYPYYLPPLSGIVFLLIGIPLWYVMVKMKGDVMESESVLKEYIDVDSFTE